MSADIKKIILALTSDIRVRPKLIKLFGHFNDFEKIWYEASLSDFLTSGLKEKDFEHFQEIKQAGLSDSRELETLEKEDIKIITFNNEEYPKPLREIIDAPPVLFVRGDIFFNQALAMVGSRKPTRYGCQMATTFSEKIADRGIAIISGLAIGLDALSHKGALAVKGKTLAVLGSGVDDASIYPQTNWSLARKILEYSGAVISEYPPNYPIHKMNFPERNRIIAGISEATLIIEANEKSGSLITADFALNYGREVMAIPGDINRLESGGTNKLIKDGAMPVLSYQDVLDFYGISGNWAGNVEANNSSEEVIIKILSVGPSHIDKIAKDAGLTTQETSSALSVMEIKGKIINQGAQSFALKR